jgi:hypothetical protein
MLREGLKKNESKKVNFSGIKKAGIISSGLLQTFKLSLKNTIRIP